MKNPVVFCIPEAIVAVTHRIDLNGYNVCDCSRFEIILIDTILGMNKHQTLRVSLNLLYQISR
ncbi:hypothetical protein SDC9_204778 [bioreactor metagenome]|uniref:Uncharacterized protein n=1 Tax=bioreactor metagenome TaxID=1076179 RepID=A0A645J9C4_9ZZZZ